MASTFQTNNSVYPTTITLPKSINGATGSISITNTNAGYSSIGTVTSSAYAWSNPNTTFSSSNGQTIMTIPHGEEKMIVNERATLEVNGTFKMNGIDVDERLKTIEKVLNIPTRDATMESKYPKLKKLYDQYMHELEKMYTWDRIKGEE